MTSPTAAWETQKVEAVGDESGHPRSSQVLKALVKSSCVILSINESPLYKELWRPTTCMVKVWEEKFLCFGMEF